MNGEVRSWVWGSTPVGCLIKCTLLVLAPFLLGLWGLDQYLHWQAAQGRHASPAAPRTTVSIQIDSARPLLPVAVLLALAIGMALVRRLAPKRVQRRLGRGIQAAGAVLALLQPGLLLGAAVTAAVCRERPRPLRFLVRGCAAAPAALLLALGAWTWGWPILLKTGHLTIAQALIAALVEVFLGSLLAAALRRSDEYRGGQGEGGEAGRQPARAL